MTTYHENQNRKVYCIDVDHTLTADPKGIYSADPDPEPNMIKAVQRLYRNGHVVIIWTARQWGSAVQLASWLMKHQVPYHGIRMEKGGSDCYVDDKNMSIEDFLE